LIDLVDISIFVNGFRVRFHKTFIGRGFGE